MPKTTESDVRELLDRTAQEIADLSSNPRAWQSWMVYLLERLEAKATGSIAQKDSFREMLPALQEAIRNRLRTGGW